MDALLRWGMIGCGAVTEKKSAPALQSVPGSALVAVASRTPSRAREWAARHGIARVYDDPAGLLADPDLNAIYVATPPDAHAEWARRAARAGKAVLYVEKPLARSGAEARALVEDCAAAGARLYVAYYRRALPAFLRIRDWLAAGEIGAVRAVRIELRRPARPEDLRPGEIPWRVRPEISGGGYFADLGSHQLDALDFLLGPLTDVRGRAENCGGLYPAEDTVDAVWRHPGGAIGAGEWRFVSPPGEAGEHGSIAGERGVISFSFFGAGPVRLVTARGEQVYLPPPVPHVQAPLIATLVAECRGEGTCPSTGVSAARTDAVMDAILGRHGPVG